MNKEEVIARLKNMLEENYCCDCDYCTNNCKNCNSHYDMIKDAIALQYAIDYLELYNHN